MKRAIMAVVFATACTNSQHADSSYRPHIERPTFKSNGPTVCIDASHHNAHTASGKYKPFARLLEADGYQVSSVGHMSDDAVPADCAVFASVNAAGGKTYRLFGINLPTKGHAERGEPAFSATQISKIKAWVERGGSLLLIADHTPYGAASASLAAAFGVDMSKGFATAKNVDGSPHNDGTQLLYSVQNGLLGKHEITRGLTRVVTFTGQSLKGPLNSTALLVLGDSAIDYVPPGPELKPSDATGRSQGVALSYGRGRVVVLGEAAMLTAQRFRDDRFGMQIPGNDNERFALNVMHWLTPT